MYFQKQHSSLLVGLRATNQESQLAEEKAKESAVDIEAEHAKVRRYFETSLTCRENLLSSSH